MVGGFAVESAATIPPRGGRVGFTRSRQHTRQPPEPGSTFQSRPRPDGALPKEDPTVAYNRAAMQAAVRRAQSRQRQAVATYNAAARRHNEAIRRLNAQLRKLR